MKKTLCSIFFGIILAGFITGCSTTANTKVGEDKVAAWQKERTPVEVLKSEISIKAAGAIVEALDIPPFGIYKALADKVDKAATMERYRRTYFGFVADVEALEKNGMSRADAIKSEKEKISKMENGQEILENLQKYLAVTKETDWDAVKAWLVKIGAELQAATDKFAQESPNALSQIIDMAQKEGGMAALTIPKQAKADLGVIGAQLKDAAKALALYREMVDADKKASQVQTDYPIEG